MSNCLTRNDHSGERGRFYWAIVVLEKDTGYFWGTKTSGRQGSFVISTNFVLFYLFLLDWKLKI